MLLNIWLLYRMVKSQRTTSNGLLCHSTPAVLIRYEVLLCLAYKRGPDFAKTVAAVYVFFLAMVLHPECARLAQKEIDEVIGSDRLPTVNDMQKLPYVHAIALEIQRWHSLAPMGVYLLV
jgi:hypothetical protein